MCPSSSDDKGKIEAGPSLSERHDAMNQKSCDKATISPRSVEAVVKVEEKKTNAPPPPPPHSSSTADRHKNPSMQPCFTREDLRPYDLLQAPMWVFDIKNECMFYANPEAVTNVWGAENLADILERDFSSDMSNTTRQRLKDYLKKFSRGETVKEQVSQSVMPHASCRRHLPRGRPDNKHEQSFFDLLPYSPVSSILHINMDCTLLVVLLSKWWSFKDYLHQREGNLDQAAS